MNARVYNHLIQTISWQVKAGHERVRIMKELLQEMNNANIRADVQTMNACLKTVTLLQENSLIQGTINSLFQEFKFLGVEPCLSTYYLVLKALYKPGRFPVHIIFLLEIKNKLSFQTGMRVNMNGVLSVIVERLLGQDLQVRDVSDGKFFYFAMDVAKATFNLPMGEKIHKLLLSKDNYKFLTNNMTVRAISLCWFCCEERIIWTLFVFSGKLVLQELCAIDAQHQAHR